MAKDCWHSGQVRQVGSEAAAGSTAVQGSPSSSLGGMSSVSEQQHPVPPSSSTRAKEKETFECPMRIKKRHSVMMAITGRTCLGMQHPTLEVRDDDWVDIDDGAAVENAELEMAVQTQVTENAKHLQSKESHNSSSQCPGGLDTDGCIWLGAL